MLDVWFFNWISKKKELPSRFWFRKKFRSRPKMRQSQKVLRPKHMRLHESETTETDEITRTFQQSSFTWLPKHDRVILMHLKNNNMRVMGTYSQNYASILFFRPSCFWEMKNRKPKNLPYLKWIQWLECSIFKSLIKMTRQSSQNTAVMIKKIRSVNRAARGK